jgi:hypothetical protein
LFYPEFYPDNPAPADEQIPLTAGREFRDTDSRDASAVVSETFVETFCPGEAVIGKRIETPDGTSLEIVGVAKDVRPLGEVRPRVYVWGPRFRKETFLLVRLASGTRISAKTLNAAVGEAVADATVTPRPLKAWLDQSVEDVARLLSLVAGLGLVSAAFAIAGVYGVVAFAISRRVREMGIRVALGAQQADLLRWVLTSSGRPVGIGLAIGLLASLIVTGSVAHAYTDVPFRLGAGSPWVFAGAGAALAGAAVAVMLAPAWRSARGDVVRALGSTDT